MSGQYPPSYPPEVHTGEARAFQSFEPDPTGYVGGGMSGARLTGIVLFVLALVWIARMGRKAGDW